MLTQKIALGGDDVAALKKTQATLERRIKSAETRSGNIVPASFPSLLEEELGKISAHSINTPTVGAVSVIRCAEFEADALMKGRYQSRKCQLLMSTDGDFLTDLGDECVVVKVFTGRELGIASTSKKNAGERSLPPDARVTVKYTMGHSAFSNL